MGLPSPRNQARQKLATLPANKFNKFAVELFYELDRRFPNLCEKTSKKHLSTKDIANCMTRALFCVASNESIENVVASAAATMNTLNTSDQVGTLKPPKSSESNSRWMEDRYSPLPTSNDSTTNSSLRRSSWNSISNYSSLKNKQLKRIKEESEDDPLKPENLRDWSSANGSYHTINTASASHRSSDRGIPSFKDKMDSLRIAESLYAQNSISSSRQSIENAVENQDCITSDNSKNPTTNGVEHQIGELHSEEELANSFESVLDTLNTKLCQEFGLKPRSCTSPVQGIVTNTTMGDDDAIDGTGVTVNCVSAASKVDVQECPRSLGSHRGSVSTYTTDASSLPLMSSSTPRNTLLLHDSSFSLLRHDSTHDVSNEGSFAAARRASITTIHKWVHSVEKLVDQLLGISHVSDVFHILRSLLTYCQMVADEAEKCQRRSETRQEDVQRIENGMYNLSSSVDAMIQATRRMSFNIDEFDASRLHSRAYNILTSFSGLATLMQPYMNGKKLMNSTSSSTLSDMQKRPSSVINATQISGLAINLKDTDGLKSNKSISASLQESAKVITEASSELDQMLLDATSIDVELTNDTIQSLVDEIQGTLTQLEGDSWTQGADQSRDGRQQVSHTLRECCEAFRTFGKRFVDNPKNRYVRQKIIRASREAALAVTPFLEL